VCGMRSVVVDDRPACDRRPVVAVHMIVVVAESKTSRGPSVSAAATTTTRSSLSLLGHCFLFLFFLGSSFFALWAILFLQSLFSSSLHDALNRRQSPRLLEQALQTFP
jgi:hypothetical protein